MLHYINPSLEQNMQGIDIVDRPCSFSLLWLAEAAALKEAEKSFPRGLYKELLGEGLDPTLEGLTWFNLV